ncbi:MAG TPA: ABC transporter substrate-binding protein [Thermoanaerobaculia bacterium]|jgi:branched-chain amino acid transport system substrate-binding protein
MKRVWVSVALLLLAVAVHGERRRAISPRRSTEITIGALFSLTGDGATLGQASAAALDLARRDINAELAALHLPFHVTTVVEDTALTPSVAAQKMSALAARDISIVLGPQSSAEAAAVRGIAGDEGMIVISQGSTASSLAIAGDNLFRLAPNDRLEGAATVTELRAAHIDVLVPLWRADAGNGGLHDSTKKSFEAAGGIVTSGASYDPATTDFAAVVSTIAAEVHAARAQHDPSAVAVYLASFEEAVAIMNLARLDPDLAAVRWYGADGVSQSQAIVGDPGAAAFAASVSFTAPNAGLSESTRDRWQPIRDEIAQRVGFVPDAFALSVYDAAWVSVLSAIEVDGRTDVLRESFVRNVQRYFGLTGPTALDAAGDRKIASFDFWTVRIVDGVAQWVLTDQI